MLRQGGDPELGVTVTCDSWDLGGLFAGILECT